MNDLERLTERYPALAGMKEEIAGAFRILKESYENGGKLLVCGNGGSASDSDHIVGELMKGFYKKRPLSEEEKEKYGELAGHLQERSRPFPSQGIRPFPRRFSTMWIRKWFLPSRCMDMAGKAMC